MTYQYNASVFIGRMRPFHKAHSHIVRRALQISEKLYIVVGSADAYRDTYNLFTHQETIEMIKLVFSEYLDRIIFVPIRDVGIPALWCNKVRESVENLNGNKNITLIGHQKDGTSYYQKMFPEWDNVPVDDYEELSATNIRNSILSGDVDGIKPYVDDEVYGYIQEWALGPELSKVVKEKTFMENYLKGFECESNKKFKITPKFYTADNVVLCAGHVLMVLRGSYPAKGAWALPGGHVEDDENAEQASLRELAEETKIDISKSVLRQVMYANRVFDPPYRSTRRRTITNAFAYNLEPMVKNGKVILPRVKASDDAKRAIWFPISKVLNEMRSNTMEDHAQIIEWALSQQGIKNV